MSTSNPATSQRREVLTACEMCINECGLKVIVENDKIVGVEGLPEHPSKGSICVKARQIPDWVYHKDRLKYPQKKVNGTWKRISWEEALDTISIKLKDLKEKYGGTALAVIAGDPVSMQERLGWDMIWRFCDVYGCPSRFYPGDLCGSSKFRALLITAGKMLRADMANSKCVMIWAADPQRSMVYLANDINEAIRKGAKIIVIDPRRTGFAKKADIYIQPRLGTDGALALAFINVIIGEDLYDKEFVADYTIGFDKLEQHVKQYTPEWAEKITGVAAEDIRKIARLYASNRPGTIFAGMKLQQASAGFHTSRSIIIIDGLLGNIDVPGGQVRVSFNIRQRPARLFDKFGDMRLTGATEYPLLHEVGGRLLGEGVMSNFSDLVLEGKPYKVRMMFIIASNPVITWPNTPRVRQALEALDFLVSMDVFMTATAEYADIVLPACTFLEKYSMPDVTQAAMLRRPIIPTYAESWSDCKFWRELAQKMGYEKEFPWKSDEETLDYYLEPSGTTVKQLRDESLTGMFPVTKAYYEYKKKGFKTSSGKFEFYCEELKTLGYDPMPIYREPAVGPVTTPELTAKYPVNLITGVREAEFWHSQFRDLPKLQSRKPEPLADIHPDTAKKYSIEDGDMMIVENWIGSIEIKARVTEDIMPNVVNVPHAWPQASGNMLTDDKPIDPEVGYPAFTALLCRIRKKE